MNKLKKIKKNSGQVAIIVLLVSAIVLTLGLSASRKTVTDLKVDTDEELLKEAFNVAESSINNYIGTGSTIYSIESGGAGAMVNAVTIGNGTSLSSDGSIQPGFNQLFWLVSHTNTGGVGITYYAGDITSLTSSSNKAALKIDYFYIEDSSGDYKVDRIACKTGNLTDTNLVGFDSLCSSLSFVVSGRKPLLIVVTPINIDTELVLTGTTDFPAQGEDLTAVGTADNGVKTQVKTKNIYQVPSFLTESVTAKSVIGY